LKLLRTGMIGCALILQCVASWAALGVRISDLNYSPTPPNPIKVWGKVTSVSPVKISDGRGEIQVNGLTASLNDFVIVTGDWNGTVLTAANPYTGEMIHIPAGSFLMGNCWDGDDATYHFKYWEESPQHSVTLSGYYIGKYEVTRGEYRKFIDAGGYSTQSYWSADGWTWIQNNSRTQPAYWDAVQTWGSVPFTQTDNHPVVGVLFYEAEAFCNWAGGHLPTEAQWERAARWNAATNHPNVYPWEGDLWVTGVTEQNCNNAGDNLYAWTAPVGSYSSYPSPSGCQDMAGNVSEWCSDWYHWGYYSQTPSGGWIDPQGPAPNPSYGHVRRGGGWGDYPEDLRCARRYFSNTSYTFRNIGFRLAR
jgi:iron(II)-dependent oxidoreductase